MSWTKDAEIAWLKKAITHLGPNSYLGPWLAENAGRIAQDITSDITPTAVLPGDAYRNGTEMLEATKRECEAMLEAATKKKDTMLRDAAASVEGYKAMARVELRRIADRI